MILITAALVAALAGATAPMEQQSAAGAQRRVRAADSDETVAVTRGTRLSINSFAGEVVVRVWGREAVRVQGRHSQRARVNVRPTGAALLVNTSGSPAPVDFEIDVPAWMPLKIEGTYIFISVQGTDADVTAETVRGDIVIKGGASIVAKSIEGEVVVEGGRGRINASSVNQGVSISGASGDIVAETVNGHITLNGVDVSSAELGSVNGHIRFDGTAGASGKYRFSTHNGNIAVTVPETANAAFTVRTYNGNVTTNLPLQGGGDPRRGQRVTYILGSGNADFELESFGGTIQLRRRGSDLPLGRVRANDKSEKDRQVR